MCVFGVCDWLGLLGYSARFATSVCFSETDQTRQEFDIEYDLPFG